MKFFQSIIKSCYDLNWIIGQKTKQKAAWGYYVLFILVVTVLVCVPLLVKIPQGVDTITSAIETKVPNFSFTLKDGIADVQGLEQPYQFIDEEDPSLVVVDTASDIPPTLDDYNTGEYQMVFLLTKNRLSIYDKDKGQTKVQELSQLPDFYLDKDRIRKVANTYISWPVLTGLFFVILVFAFIAWACAKLVYLLILTAIVKLIATIGGKKGHSFKDLFTMALYIMTLPTLISVFGSRLLHVLTGQPGYLPFVYTAVFLIMMLMIVFQKSPYQKKTKK